MLPDLISLSKNYYKLQGNMRIVANAETTTFSLTDKLFVCVK